MSQRKRYDTQKWEYEFQAHGVTYRKSGYETLKECRAAEARARDEAHAKALREPGQASRMTLNDYVELWKGDHVKANCRATTGAGYARSLTLHILPVFGHVPLVDLKKADLRAHFAKLANSGMARSTVRNCLVPLRALLNQAVDDELLDSNPVAKLGRKARARTEREAAKVIPYSEAELAAILAAADSCEPDFAALFHTLGRSGVREAEGLGLQPKDIHDDHLWVRRNVQWLGSDLHVFAAKSGQTRRVDIPPELAQRIKAAAATSPGPYIFGGAVPIRPETLRRRWRHILERTPSVDHKTVHDLRHTYAGILLAKGAPPKYVQEQLGHSSIKVTYDIYGHLIPGTNRKWVDDTF